VQLLFLGTSGSWPTPKRNPSAVALKRGPEVILFDCGEGTQRQFMQSPLSFMRVSRIFISHFHGDHFLGLPGLVQTMTMNGREDSLHVYGPQGASETVHTLLKFGYFAPSFPVKVEELRDGDVVPCDGYEVRALEALHTVPALSYVLEEHVRPGRFDLAKAKALGIPEGPLYRRLQRGETIEVDGRAIPPEMVLGPPRRGRKIAYSGDTKPSQRLEEAAVDCDVLIHDATAESSLEEKANRYGHSTGRQAAEIAKATGARLLVLTHISPRYDDPTPILDDARTVFEPVVLAEDFLSLDVPYPE
jgi:ribonuclease Z